jgi:hypothetical protein
MFVEVHHEIRDAQAWAETTGHILADMQAGRLPEGLKGLMYLPSADGRQADCLWEAVTLENLKSFIDRKVGNAARNEYFQVDDHAAVGLPRHAGPRTAVETRVEEDMLLTT